MIADYPGDGFILETPQKLRRIVAHFRAHYGMEPHVAPRCNAPWVSAVLESNGDVRPCFFHAAIGNTTGTTLGAVLNGPRAVAFRESLHVADNPTCQRCVAHLTQPGAEVAIEQGCESLYVLAIVVDEVAAIVWVHGQGSAAPERQLAEWGTQAGGDKRFQRIPEAELLEEMMQAHEPRGPSLPGSCATGRAGRRRPRQEIGRCPRAGLRVAARLLHTSRCGSGRAETDRESA